MATRPFGENGLGMSAMEAATELEKIKAIFSFCLKPYDLPVMGNPGHPIPGDG